MSITRSVPFLRTLALAGPLLLAPEAAVAQQPRAATCPARQPANESACSTEQQRCSYADWNFCVCSRATVHAPGTGGGLEGPPRAAPAWQCFRSSPAMGPLAPPELAA